MDLSQFFSSAGAISGIIFGAIAGAISAEIRDRLKERRSKSSYSKTLRHAFYCQIEKDCSMLVKYQKSSISKTALLSCLSTILWQEKQIDISHHVPELTTLLADYFRELDILIGKLAYTPNTTFVPFVNNVSKEDIYKVIDSGKIALKALSPLVFKP